MSAAVTNPMLLEGTFEGGKVECSSNRLACLGVPGSHRPGYFDRKPVATLIVTTCVTFFYFLHLSSSV